MCPTPPQDRRQTTRQRDNKPWTAAHTHTHTHTALRTCAKATCAGARDAAICRVQQWVAQHPHEKILLDLERARMEREDFRHGNAPATQTYKDGKWEWMSYIKLTNGIIDHHNEATDALMNIRTELRDMAGRDVPADLVDYLDTMDREIEAVLGESSDDESED